MSAGMNVPNSLQGQRPKAMDVSPWYGVYSFPSCSLSSALWWGAFLMPASRDCPFAAGPESRPYRLVNARRIDWTGQMSVESGNDNPQ